jgi:hypothetical protein
MTGFGAPVLEPLAVDPAPVGRRTGAALIDMLPVLALLVGAAVCRFGTGLSGWVAVALVGVAVVWLAVCWWGSWSGGRTIGKRVLGLVEVIDGPGSGARPSSGRSRALARLLLRGTLSLLTLGVAGLSYRWDPAGRERTWWDRLTGTRVVPARAGGRHDAGDLSRWAPDPGSAPDSPSPAGLSTPSDHPSPAAVSAPSDHPSSSGHPSPPGGRSAPSSADVPSPAGLAAPQRVRSTSAATDVPSPAGLPAPAIGAGGGWVPDPTPPESVTQSTSRVAPMPPLPPGVGPSRLPRSGSDFLRPELIGGANRAVPHSPEEPDRPPTGHPGSPGVANSAAAPKPAAGGAAPVPDNHGDGGTLAPPLITGIAGPGAPGADRSWAARSRPPAVGLIWDTGRHLTVTGRVLIGRDPSPRDGERANQLLPVSTDSVGVSKTHLQIDVGAGGITVTDRRSTNGVRVLRGDGTTERCTPEEPMPVRAGDVVHFGGRFLTIAG